MSESDDDSNVSENNWPMNEDWLIEILRGEDQTGGKVKINVIIFWSNEFWISDVKYKTYIDYSILARKQYASMALVISATW